MDSPLIKTLPKGVGTRSLGPSLAPEDTPSLPLRLGDWESAELVCDIHRGICRSARKGPAEGGGIGRKVELWS